MKDDFGQWIDSRDVEGVTIVPEGTTIEVTFLVEVYDS